MTNAGTRGGLRAEIERNGYYPALVAEGVLAALGPEEVTAHLVHQETTFDHDQVRRHVTVLVLTPSRLLVGHTDEHGPDDSSPVPYATTSVEAVRLERVGAVVVSRVVADPARYQPGSPPQEVQLSVGWGAVGRVELEPASCGDPACEADHGYTGTVGSDDLGLRVSAAAEGPEVVSRTLEFAAALSVATARR